MTYLEEQGEVRGVHRPHEAHERGRSGGGGRTAATAAVIRRGGGGTKYARIVCDAEAEERNSGHATPLETSGPSVSDRRVRIAGWYCCYLGRDSRQQG